METRLWRGNPAADGHICIILATVYVSVSELKVELCVRQGEAAAAASNRVKRFRLSSSDHSLESAQSVETSSGGGEKCNQSSAGECSYCKITDGAL